MSWQSPIGVDYIQRLAEDLETAVYKAVFDVNITVDRDELIKALAYDRQQYQAGYADGYVDAKNDIVRCKDCMYWEQAKENSGACNRAFEITAYADDFCSYGKRW